MNADGRPSWTCALTAWRATCVRFPGWHRSWRAYKWARFFGGSSSSRWRCADTCPDNWGSAGDTFSGSTRQIDGCSKCPASPDPALVTHWSCRTCGGERRGNLWMSARHETILRVLPSPRYISFRVASVSSSHSVYPSVCLSVSSSSVMSVCRQCTPPPE